MSAGLLACMTTPSQGNRVPDGAWWAADNGKFGKGWPGTRAWWEWLQGVAVKYDPARCLFATAPDVVGDSEATTVESRPWLPMIRSIGLPAAFVAQDGCERRGLIPWGEFDVLFLGGSTEFKLSDTARRLTAHARGVGLDVHMGRVNSRRRLRIADDWGCTSADGTFLAFGPDKNLPQLLGWLEEIKAA
jgi:hypothetical protein